MNIDGFLAHFETTNATASTLAPRRLQKKTDDAFRFCVDRLGGKTFNSGLYRVYRWDQIEERTEALCELFLAAKGQIIVFAADWSGRQYALDFTSPKRGKPTVSCFDPGAPDTFCTDEPILAFHNRILVEKPASALSVTFFNKWRKKHQEPVEAHQCVGYKVPLFLNGKDVLSNLELMDMDVYIDLCTQLWHAVKSLPAGTPVRQVLLKRKKGKQGK